MAEKSNEIIAIPKLLDMLAIEGAILTIDAMGCQRDIAQRVIDKKADYVLALKGNQGSLRDDAELFVTEQKASGFVDCLSSRSSSLGRRLRRRSWMIQSESAKRRKAENKDSAGQRRS